MLSYDGQERSPGGRPRPEGSEGMKSSSRADYGQRWPREGTDATDADFGGNGSSSDSNEGILVILNMALEFLNQTSILSKKSIIPTRKRFTNKIAVMPENM